MDMSNSDTSQEDTWKINKEALVTKLRELREAAHVEWLKKQKAKGDEKKETQRQKRLAKKPVKTAEKLSSSSSSQCDLLTAGVPNVCGDKQKLPAVKKPIRTLQTEPKKGRTRTVATRKSCGDSTNDAIPSTSRPGISSMEQNEKCQHVKLCRAVPEKCKTTKPRKTSKKKMTQKDLELQREKERLKKRKQLEKLKQNPEAYELAKQKERKRYQRRKKAGKIKLISDLKVGVQRRVRGKWRTKKRAQRLMKASEAKLQKDLEANSPPLTPEDGPTPPPHDSRPKARQKAKNKANRSLINDLHVKLAKSITRAERLKKRLQRMQKFKGTGSPTPRKKVRELLKNPRAVKKRLLFGEVVISQLKANFKSCRSNKEKQTCAKVVAGQILKKYKVLEKAREFLSIRLRRFCCVTAGRRQHKTTPVSTLEREKVRKFLEDDCNSCMTPGVKDTITRKKSKQRKRYLANTLKNLHKKYQQESGSKLSYSSFCKIKPFWVVQRKVDARDTCLCEKHANFQFLVEKLHMLKILKQNRAEDLCGLVCCDTKKKECMQRECRRCQGKTLPLIVQDHQTEDETFYYQWLKVSEVRQDKNKKDLKVKFVKKEKLVTTVGALVKKTITQFPFFLQHVYNNYHQYHAIKELKNSLCNNEAVVLIDFSENYGCKYATEVQSAHFGAAKAQVTLHTGVIYYNSSDLGCEPQHLSFCTISKSLRHDACAVWAHLQPVIQLLQEKFPTIDTIHFQSDGPTTQYRNKTNFYLIIHFATTWNFKEVTWNFSEAGHGKGSADGIGGTIKTAADRAVSQGKDVSNSDALIEVLKEAELKVKIFEISDKDIEIVDGLLPSNSLKALPNTLKLHQVAWEKKTPNMLSLRLLSCFSCGGSVCKHFTSTPSTSKVVSALPVNNIASVPDSEPSPFNLNTESNLEASVADDILTPLDTMTTRVDVNQWVAVVYDDNWYPGIVEHVSNDNMQLNFMARSGKRFFWPTKPDRQTLPFKEMLCVLRSPPIPITSRHYEIKNSAQIDAKLSSIL